MNIEHAKSPKRRMVYGAGDVIYTDGCYFLLVGKLQADGENSFEDQKMRTAINLTRNCTTCNFDSPTFEGVVERLAGNDPYTVIKAEEVTLKLVGGTEVK